jgi:hypothetical protein
MQQGLNHNLRPFDIQLDSTIVKVPDPADQPALNRHPCGKRTIPHALHASADRDKCSNRLLRR